MDSKHQQKVEAEVQEETLPALPAVDPRSGLFLALTASTIEALKAARKLLFDFIHENLKEAQFTKEAMENGTYGEGDYGIIPGTKRRSLFKAGAEKLMRLFNLGVRFKPTMKEIDHVHNFVLFAYEADIYCLRTGNTIAKIEGSANSGEEKYKFKTVWKEVEKNGALVWEPEKVEVSAVELINTLMAMAQKRAMVAGVRIATGATEYFTQDMIEVEDFIAATRDVSPKQKREISAAKRTKSRNREQKAPQSEQKAPKMNKLQAAMCCGRKMIPSKYFDRQLNCIPLYCTKCAKKVRPEGFAA